MFEMYTSGVQAKRSVSRACGEHVQVLCFSCVSCYLCQTHTGKTLTQAVLSKRPSLTNFGGIFSTSKPKKKEKKKQEAS